MTSSSNTTCIFVTEVPNPERDVTSSLGLARSSLLSLLGPNDTRLKVACHFDTIVTAAIQERETEYVNTMSLVFQGEMKSLKQNEREAKRKTLKYERDVHLLRGKVDRRETEMNAQRKSYYKEILLLRELVTHKKADPKTLKTIDGN